MADEVQFETMKSKDVKFGANNFLEIARKKAITDTGENVFISISRGFFTPENEKRFRKSVSMPFDKETVEAVSKALLEVSGEEKPAKKSKEPKVKEEPVDDAA